MRILSLKSRRNLIIFILSLIISGCGPKAPVPSILPELKKPSIGPPTGEKIDFFPTAQRARDDIASLINLTESRVDATFSAVEDSTIVKEEEKTITEIQQKEYTTYEDLVMTLDQFLQLIPAGGRMDQDLTKGRGNLVAKFDSYNKAIDAGITDQVLDPLEKTAIESNARSFVTELQFIESSLPLPIDSLKVGPTFIVEEDSVDLFFEIVDEIEDMTKEIEELRKTLREYQKAKAEMEAFLEREKVLAQGIQESKEDIGKLYSGLDSTRQEQEKAYVELDTKIKLETDSIRKVIRQVDNTIKGNMTTLASTIADSIAMQQRQSDSLFFEMGTSMELFQEEIDSLKGVVRYYDVAEKGLPLLDEDVLNILKLPLLRHKITLKNGTIVIGQILAENQDVIIMQTSVGKLVIEKYFISKYDEKIFPRPKVEFEGDYEVIEHDDYEEFKGMVRNVGNKRADFVKVIFFLWGATTEPVGVGSAFVDGTTIKFSTGVISDSSIEPNGTASYHVRVEKQPGKKVSYRTNDVKWREFE